MAKTIIELQPDGGGGGDPTTMSEAYAEFEYESDWGDGYVIRIHPGSSPTGGESFRIRNATPSPTSRVEICAAPGYGARNGERYPIDEVSTISGLIEMRLPYLRIGPVDGIGEGLQWTAGADHAFTIDVSQFTTINGDNCEIDSCHIWTTDPKQQSGVVGRISQVHDVNGNTAFTLKNNIFQVDGDLDLFTQNNAILSCGSTDNADAITMTFDIYNNLMYTDCAANGSGDKVHQALKVFNQTANGTIAGTVKNNIAISTGAAFSEAYDEGASGTYTITGDNNAAQDSSFATLLGGSNEITDVVAADEFVDHVNHIFRLKSSGQCVNAGTADVVRDMYNRLRDAGHHSMGPIEFYRSSHGLVQPGGGLVA